MCGLDHAHIQVGQAARLVVEAAAGEANDHIGEALLRLNVEIAIAPAFVELPAHLVDGIAAHRAVTNDLPLLLERVLRIEVDAHMGQAAQGGREQGMETMSDENLRWRDLFWICECPGGVIVDRLFRSFAARETLKMLGHQVQVIGSRVQGADAGAQAGSAVKEVIVVQTDMLNALPPEHAHHSIRQCGLTRTTIATDCDNQWILHPGVLHTLPLRAIPARFVRSYTHDRSLWIVARRSPSFASPSLPGRGFPLFTQPGIIP